MMLIIIQQIFIFCHVVGSTRIKYPISRKNLNELPYHMISLYLVQTSQIVINIIATLDPERAQRY
jgi:hypothetical protein